MVLFRRKSRHRPHLEWGVRPHGGVSKKLFRLLHQRHHSFPIYTFICISDWFTPVWLWLLPFSSVAQLHLTLRPHGLQHARPPCPSPTPGACSNSVHHVSDAIQPSHPLSSPSPLAFNLSQHQGNFPMSQFFALSGRSIGVSASASVPVKIQDWSPLGWTGWISLQSKCPSRVFSNTTVQKHQFYTSSYNPVLLVTQGKVHL